MKGTVRWYNNLRGFGFILGEDDKDVFIHRSVLPLGTILYGGDKVEYKTENSERGLQARNITKL
jgi:CspA family cold shock protein